MCLRVYNATLILIPVVIFLFAAGAVLAVVILSAVRPSVFVTVLTQTNFSCKHLVYIFQLFNLVVFCADFVRGPAK